MGSLQGKHWEIRRELIDPDRVLEASIQAEELRESRPGYVEEFEPPDISWDDGLQVLRVMLEHMPEDDREAFSTLVGVAQTVNEIADAIVGEPISDGEGAVFLNFYEPGAATREHRDRYTAATVALGLSGVAKAHIRDSVDQMWLPPIPLYPTDAFCLDNTVPLGERPLHILRATLEAPRIAIVNATV